ncbi:unnamed protein product [Hymenolepis diminuta]|uniref:Uncharacterized protein n=1 Tax=Hymenolepis diminuta TaxID=6216 RepID=A0A564YKI9_HYMDI|nr:unnamed protein product [Hymenolepis diminuta]
MFSRGLIQLTHKSAFAFPLKTQRTPVNYRLLRFPFISSVPQSSPLLYLSLSRFNPRCCFLDNILVKSTLGVLHSRC